MLDEWVELNLGRSMLEINRRGQIRQKEVRTGRGGKGVRYNVMRKQSLANGYHYIAVRNSEGGQKNHYVHRLVAMIFVSNPDNKPHVNHKDGNKSNNYADNLEWVTPAENSKHAYDTGLMKLPSRRGSVPKALSPEQYNEVIERLERGDKQRDIARDFGVHFSLISHIKAGRR